MCLGVQKDISIGIECVMMMAVREWELDLPGTVEVLLHWIRIRVPVVEITDERNRRAARHNADEVGRSHGFLWRQMIV